MTTPRTTDTVSRRTALAGLGAGGLGLALATTQSAAAQDASPTAMANHPFVGTWIIDRDPNDPSEIPTYNVITADGGIIDPTVGGAGVWEPTGPDTANFTLTGTITELSAYFIARGSVMVAADGGSATNSYSSTIIAADGTTMDDLTIVQGTATYVRVRVEPQEWAGQPIAGFPAWTPAPPAEATPSA